VLLTACNKSAEVVSVPVSATTSANNIADSQITLNVHTALNNNQDLTGLDIKVITTKGDVQLIGDVRSQAQVDTITKLARAAEGAHAIHNELTIKK
jgi:osmotically-inducible protein OsmY